MLFNSVDFAVFLPIVFAIYWMVGGKHVQRQNLVLLASSYVFYAWWDWRFLSLLLISTLVDFWVGARLHKTEAAAARKRLLWLSIGVNIGLLGFFKYFNFFVESFTNSFQLFGGEIDGELLNIILPVGISFYTFQTLTYTIDIYRKQCQPTHNFVAFATFVAFFPQLVAGPIERARNLLPQFLEQRKFDRDQAVVGIKQIIWGLFKKVVIADGCAQYVNEIFSNYDQYQTPTLILGAVYFAFQIYADFSGYSDIAIGTARLFNINLKVNFRYPYFATNLTDFWHRWHISLSQWFRDYVYFPLGGSHTSKFNFIRNIVIVFVVSGLWHGANWTFIVWGAYHALIFIMWRLFDNNSRRKKVEKNGLLLKLRFGFGMLCTFVWVTLGWIIFRSPSMTYFSDYMSRLFQFQLGIDLLYIQRYVFEMLPLIVLLVIIEWYARKKEFPLSSTRWSLVQVTAVIGMIIFFGSFSNPQDFIYFRF